MKRIVFLPLIFSVLLLAGAGCPTSTLDQTASAPTSQPESQSAATVTEPFDTNDYLDAALAELETVE